MGYRTPIYHFALTIKEDFPRVMNAHPENYTSYIERNPVGSNAGRNLEIRVQT
jgi:hypothetical protein